MAVNAIAERVIEHNLLAIANKIEDQVDEKIHKLERLDEDDLDRIRERRLATMKKQAEKRAEWRKQGHGDYREIFSEKEFFAEMKGVERMVCHFFRENWPCKVMDKHLSLLASQHVETKFVKINAEKSPFLTERLKIWMLPTLALIKNEKTTDYVVGFDDMGGSDDFDTSILANRLAHGGMINYEGGDYGEGGSAGSRMKVVQKRNIRSRDEDEEDSDFDD